MSVYPAAGTQSTKCDGYNPAHSGCTECGSQDTVTFDGRFGRRCAEHPPWLALADLGLISDAFYLLRCHLAARAWGLA